MPHGKKVLVRAAATAARFAQLEAEIAASPAAMSRVHDQVGKAKRELARGNMYGLEYHLAAAEDALSIQQMQGSPGTITRLARAAERQRATSEARRRAASSSIGKRGLTDLKAKALAEYGISGLGPQEFAKQFERAHPECHWQTVRQWIYRSA